MGKSISNLYRYIEISKSIIKRYIEALPEIDNEEVPLTETEKVSARLEQDNRVYSGFNILNEETVNVSMLSQMPSFSSMALLTKPLEKKYLMIVHKKQ